MNSSFSEAIRTLSFLPTALRRSSARAGENPAISREIAISCSWYTATP